KKIDATRAPGKSALGRAADSVKALGKQIAAAPALVPPASDLPPAPGVLLAPSDRKGRRIVSPPASRPLAVQIVEQPGSELQYVGDLIKPFLRPLAVFGMVLIVSLYLLVEHNDLRNRLFRLVGLDQLNVMTLALND